MNTVKWAGVFFALWVLVLAVVAQSAKALVIVSSPTPKTSAAASSKSSVFNSSSAKSYMSSLNAVYSSITSTSSISASSVAASSAPAQIMDMRVSWKRCTERGSGKLILPGELAGYEIRYRPKKCDCEWLGISMIPPVNNSYKFGPIPYNDYDIDVACYDTQGLYSEFVPTSGYDRPVLPQAGPVVGTVRK